MRTQLIESMIIGLLISAVVLLARWLFPRQLLLEMIVVLVGAAVLTILQLVLQHRSRGQAANEPSPSTAESPQADPHPTTPLHSPRLEWADGAPPDSLSVTSPELPVPTHQSYTTEAEPATITTTEVGESDKKVV